MPGFKELEGIMADDVPSLNELIGVDIEEDGLDAVLEAFHRRVDPDGGMADFERRLRRAEQLRLAGAPMPGRGAGKSTRMHEYLARRALYAARLQDELDRRHQEQQAHKRVRTIRIGRGA